MVQMSGNDTATQEEVVPVNKLEGGVYPTEAETTSQTLVRVQFLLRMLR